MPIHMLVRNYLHACVCIRDSLRRSNTSSRINRACGILCRSGLVALKPRRERLAADPGLSVAELEKAIGNALIYDSGYPGICFASRVLLC